jgi:hypothetical protein
VAHVPPWNQVLASVLPPCTARTVIRAPVSGRAITPTPSGRSGTASTRRSTVASGRTATVQPTCAVLPRVGAKTTTRAGSQSVTPRNASPPRNLVVRRAPPHEVPEPPAVVRWSTSGPTTMMSV